MLYQTNNFQHKENTSMYLRDTFTQHVDESLNEISDTQTIFIAISFNSLPASDTRIQQIQASRQRFNLHTFKKVLC